MLIPGAPLGLITEGVQALAGVLLPASTILLIMLCNDKEILGPWVNQPWLNGMAGVIVGVLVLLSLTLTAATLFPHLTGRQLTAMLAGGAVLGARRCLGWLLTRLVSAWRLARLVAAGGRYSVAGGIAAGSAGTAAGRVPGASDRGDVSSRAAQLADAADGAAAPGLVAARRAADLPALLSRRRGRAGHHQDRPVRGRALTPPEVCSNAVLQ